MPAGGLTLDGHLIRTMRENQGLSMTEAAQRAGISASFLSNIELGYRLATPPTAKAIADVLGVTIGDIRDGKDQPAD